MTKEKVRIKYYECNLTKAQHLAAYLIFVAIISVILFIYYHNIIVSLIGAAVIALFQEKIYARQSIKKRQNKLRSQFKDFLEIINISISGGGGRNLENAIKDSEKELKMLYGESSDIVREIWLIIADYQLGRRMSESFMELGERSDVEDIKSFAAVLSTIEGKTSDFGYIVKQTHDIICDKTAIIMEIQTSITSSKSEAYMMLIMPLVIVIAMSAMGSGFMDSLFTTTSGRIAATIGVISMIVSYVLAMKATNIDV